MDAVFAAEAPKCVIHLAAQAGVRHSVVNPAAYVDSNLVGLANVLEGCRHHGVNHPISLYAATKKGQ